MADTRDEELAEVPGQMDLLDQIPGETRGTECSTPEGEEEQ
ncbi:hypothetical protein [Brevibacterium sediminis]